MKRRWIKLAALSFVILVLVVSCLLAWFFRPTSGTLVEQAARSDIPGLKRSLFLGARINGYGMWGWQRENKGDTPLTSAVQHGSLETVGFLLGRGADPNQRDGSGMPPISWAAIHGRLDVAKALVEKGAKPDKSAVEHARRQGHSALADYLLTSGAAP